MELISERSPAVSVAQFVAATHMPTVGDDAGRFAIELALGSAEAMVERASGRPLVQGSYRFELHAGWAAWSVPILPVASVTQIEAQDAAGAWSDLDLSGVVLRDAYSGPRLEMPPACGASRLRITLLAGYEVNPPLQLRQAIILLAKEWFEAGVAVEDQAALDLSFGALRLIRQVRYRAARQFEWVG